MINTLSAKKADRILFVLGSFLLAYTTLRAALLCITWDEAYTYIEFARNGKVWLQHFDMMSANNHLLNTALMILFTRLFGLHEFVMRIPPLLAHILFLFYSGMLLKKLDNKWIVISAFIIINVNPYMLDFFSIARGYGLSLGLMMGSIYYFYLFHTGNKKTINSGISVFYACLSVFASFVLLNYLVCLYAMLLILNIYFSGRESTDVKRKLRTFLMRMALPTTLILFLLIFLIPYGLRLKASGALFFGGNTGFWEDTVCTVVTRLLYERVYDGMWIERLMKALILLISLCSVLYAFYCLIKKRSEQNNLFLFSLIFLLLLISFSTIIQHKLMNTLYLMDRTVLFMLVIFGFIFVFLLHEFSKRKEFASFFLHLFAFILLIHFAFCFNLSYVLEWKYDADTKRMLDDLSEMKKIPSGKETVSIGIPLTFDPAINFYREKNQLTWLNSAWRSETNNPLQDYYFLTRNDLSEFNTDSIEIIKKYPVTGNILARPKFSPKRISIAFAKELVYKERDGLLIDSTIEYAPGFSYVVNDSTTPNKRAVLAFYAEVSAPELSEDNLVMVLSFQHANGGLYSWQKAYVKDFIRNGQDMFSANFSCIVPRETTAGDEIKAYIWNPDKQVLHIKKQELKWLSYSY